MKVKNSEENLNKCNCKKCPSFTECMESDAGGLFCARQTSMCEFEKQGCLCGVCMITFENGLFGKYYCKPVI